jgi:hypothetical protein
MDMVWTYFRVVVMKNWLPLLIGVLGSVPWWGRALLADQLQKKIDKYLNARAIKRLAIVCVFVSFGWANMTAFNDIQNQKQKEIDVTKGEVTTRDKEITNKDKEIIKLKAEIIAIQTKEQQNRQIRAYLARLIGEGFAIQDHCQKGLSDGETHKEFVAWCERADKYFKEQMEPYFHYLFENSNKHLTTIVLPVGMSAENTRVWFHVEARKRNLEEFIKDRR